MKEKPDIVFLSYDEPNAESNFKHLLARYDRAKRLHGVTGVGRANVLTAEVSDTDWYYLIDADSTVLKSFSLDSIPNNLSSRKIIVWSAINPANGLTYGYGGLKLCHRQIVRTLNPQNRDVFTTSDGAVEFSRVVASVTHFNSSPYHAWRAAFREMIALTGMRQLGMSADGILSRQKAWQNPRLLARHRRWIRLGASDACEIIEFTGIEDAQKRIHDPSWCRSQFIRRHQKR